MKMEIQNFAIDDLKPGMFAFFSSPVGEQEVQGFAQLTGDVSPLHVSRDYAASTSFKNNLVHGLLLGGYFSALVGVCLPGRQALLKGMDLQFIRPVPVGSTVTFSARVESVNRANSTLTLTLLALLNNEICAKGSASIKVRR